MSRQLGFAANESLPGYVTYIVDDTLYIEIVGTHHVKEGDSGVVMSRGREAAEVRVTEAGERYLYLQITTPKPGVDLNIGDAIVFETRIHAQGNTKHRPSSKWHELDKLVLGGELDKKTATQVSAPWEKLPFEESGSASGSSAAPVAAATRPLSRPPVAPSVPSPVVEAPPLAESSETVQSPIVTPGSPDQNVVLDLKPLTISAANKAGISQSANIYHGQLRNHEAYETTPSPAAHSLESRLDFNGSIDRLNASPWSAVWSGNESYRNGNTGQTSPDYQHPKLSVYNAMLARRNDDGGSLKMGRFLPSELPGIGFLDGGQVEHVTTPQWRFGGALAFRPDRVTLGSTTKEPLMSAYASTEQGTHGEHYYSGTLGAYHTFYRGKSDELAFLSDQRADVGSKLNLFSSLQIDVNGGAEQAHKGPRIIRLDLFGNSPVTSSVNLRAGLSHSERPDTAAERDLTAGTTIGFDNGFWRYFIGANERLPLHFSLDEDLSLIHSATAPTEHLWRVTLSRFGLFILPRGQISISAYNLTSSQGQGMGYQTTVATPLWTDNVSLNLSSSSEYSSPPNSPKIYKINDASLRLNWRLSKAWSADVGATQTYASGRATSTTADSSIGYRW